MSGGSMDYAYSKLEDAASAVRSSADFHEFPQLRIAIAQHIESLAEVLHAMEWSDSGDTGTDAWVQRAERYIGLMDLIQG